MPKGTCTIPGCDRPHSGRGWCVRHYGKWRKTGDPLFEKPTIEQRFFTKVEKTPTCWLWLGYIDEDGYGKFYNGKRPDFAHRVSHTLFIGPIPAGLQVDHLCFVRACVNPDHLEAVTQAVNNERSGSATAVNLRKDQCIHGHQFTPENTYRPASGARQCVACRRERDLARMRTA